MFKEIFIGPCFAQVGITTSLDTFAIGDYKPLIAILSFNSFFDGTDIRGINFIIGPLMIAIGVTNAVD